MFAKLETAKIESSCPACEYERNSTGKPIERGDEMECLECGATWRIFGTRQSDAVESVKQADLVENIRKKLRDSQYQAEPEGHNDGWHQSFKSDLNPTPNLSRYTPSLGIMVSCFAALVLFCGLYYGMNYLKHDSQYGQADSLYIAEVEVEEQVRRNGSKVFTVKGMVANPTDISKPIPTIAIILRQTNGKEVTRWYYNSSLPSLKSGARSRFASSIQYDTPIVAYAEAVFK